MICCHDSPVAHLSWWEELEGCHIYKQNIKSVKNLSQKLNSIEIRKDTMINSVTCSPFFSVTLINIENKGEKHRTKKIKKNYIRSKIKS